MTLLPPSSSLTGGGLLLASAKLLLFSLFHDDEMTWRRLPMHPEHHAHASLLVCPQEAGSSCPPPLHRPRLVVFDLDATLWYPELFMMSGR